MLSIKIASPGAISETTSKPNEFNATLSEEIPHDLFSSSFVEPNINGLIPFGSLKANKPYPAIMPTTAYAPEHLAFTPFIASKRSLGFRLGTCSDFNFLPFSSSFARIFNKISESEFVLICLKLS